MKKFVIVLLSLVGILFIYAIVEAIVISVDKNTLKYNINTSEHVNLEKFEAHSDYHNYVNQFSLNYPNEAISIDLSSYTDSKDVTYLGAHLGENSVIETLESSFVTYEVDINEAGFYRILITYYPETEHSTSANIERGIKINGEYPFLGSENVTFLRIWGSKEAIKKDIYGNDIRPSQIELPKWTKSYIKDNSGYITEPYLFYFRKGINEITLNSIREGMLIGDITLDPVKELKTYEEIKATYEANGYKAVNEKVHLEAEHALYTTSPTLYPLNDRTSSKTSTSSPGKIILNSIGGDNWRVNGNKIAWEFTVPTSGLYEISMRVKQNLAKGMTVSRNIYLDDEIPFKELENYEFKQSGDWRLQTLGTKKEGYLFYLEEGKHELAMETSLGNYGILLSEINNSIIKLNTIYREIVVFTGAEPDEHRDYQLHLRMPDLVDRLKEERKMLVDIRQALIDLSGSKSEKTGILDTFILQLNDFIKKPSAIHKKLASFESNVASLGTLMTLLDQQPLEIDYFVIHGSGVELKRAKENKFEGAWYSIRRFIASFTTNYAAVGKTSTEATETIEVWITMGQDQTNILRKLIDESFTPNKGIQVDLKLVSGAALLPATLSGVGPDVSIGVGGSVPVNYAMRGAAADLTKFPDYEEVVSQFHESAIVPFTYQGGVYAMPETQTFLMMFYRTDIFEDYGFAVPNTWDDVIALIPNLQKYNLDFYLPIPASQAGMMNLPPNPIFSTLFYQHDGNFYLKDGKESGFNEGEGPEVFKFWTEFYTDYSFPLTANFPNRFRSGQMPIGITYYNLYNTLAVFAPEIRGRWDFDLVPGTKYIDEHGNTQIRRETVASSSGIMMLEQSKKKEASWEFIKWWTGTETQVRFGRELEGILGAAARHPTANIAAMQQLPWRVSERDKLNEQWIWTRGIPETPGSYMTGRHLDNAFRRVINDNANPRETIYDYVLIINRELETKRKEFGLD